MSVRLEMLQVARLAPKLLGDSTSMVRDFFRQRQNVDGGFPDRSGRSDLYYTVFGIEGLRALDVPLPISELSSFLESFGPGTQLDLVHACCLARCRASVLQSTVQAAPATWAQALLARIEHFRSSDGGYHVTPASAHGTAYGSFLALAAYQDLGMQPPQPEGILASLAALETPDGVWSNEPGMNTGATNPTAATVTFLRQIGLGIPTEVGDWLLARHHRLGGFVAIPAAPMPDLLSTSTALHALAGLGRDLSQVKESCLDFIDTLWSNEGGFHGHWGDDMLDCEYTYYGLLALGHLALV